MRIPINIKVKTFPIRLNHPIIKPVNFKNINLVRFVDLKYVQTSGFKRETAQELFNLNHVFFESH